MSLRRLAPTIMEAAETASCRLGWSPEGSLLMRQQKEG
jgi:hypothetical protein